MGKKKMQEHLALIAEVRSKINLMHAGSVFITDFRACALLEKLLDSYQNLLAENIKLRERTKLSSLDKRTKKKT